MSIGGKGLAGGFFLLIGGGFFIMAAYNLADTVWLAWRGVATSGEITGYEVRGHRGGRIMIYRFVDGEGRTVEGRTRIAFSAGGIGASQQRAASVGRKIAVIYDPSDPTRSIANTFRGRWAWLAIMLFVSPHILIGAWLIWRDRQEQREDGWTQRRF